MITSLRQAQMISVPKLIKAFPVTHQERRDKGNFFVPRTKPSQG